MFARRTRNDYSSVYDFIDTRTKQYKSDATFDIHVYMYYETTNRSVYKYTINRCDSVDATNRAPQINDLIAIIACSYS